MIKVLHSQNTRDSGFYPYDLREGEITKAELLEKVMSDEYVQVGEVYSDELEDAWMLTNSIHDHWSENKRVTSLLGKKVRSSMMGDVFVKVIDRADGVEYEFYMVNFCGFTKLN